MQGPTQKHPTAAYRLLALALGCGLLACGCIQMRNPALGIARPGQIWNQGPGAAVPGLLSAEVAYPHELQKSSVVEIDYDSSRVEILGWVETANTSGNFSVRLPGPLGDDVLAERDSDYRTALRQLMNDHRLDGLLNKVVDTRRWVLNFYFFRFHTMRTVVGGVGFRFRTPPGVLSRENRLNAPTGY